MIRALIVDDEAPARAKLRRLLEAEEGFAVAGEAADGVEAVAALGRGSFGAVFLDIQMPRLDGFGVIAEVGVEAMPPVVFVTAYDEHALAAFEVHAVDYLLKPFAAARFRRVAERLRQLADGGAGAGELAAKVERLLAAVSPPPRYLERLLAQRGKEREVLLAVDRIDLIRAHRNTVRLHTADGVLTRRATLTSLAERLDPDRFLRINRSEIVRLDAVAELQPWFHGDYRVILKDGTVLTWSRRYRARDKNSF